MKFDTHRKYVQVVGGEQFGFLVGIPSLLSSVLIL